MASPVIPKEQLTAYQRWELLGFDEAPNRGRAGAAENAEAITLPTAAEIEQIHQQAAQEGFKIGHDEGFKTGYKAGYEEGRTTAEAVVKRLTVLAEALDKEQLRQDEEIARELLALALSVSKQMLRTALKVKAGLVMEVIREAMNALPSLSGHLRVMVHPDDIEPMRAFMESEYAHLTFKVAPDPRLEQGGFRIESSYSEVDGQLPTRWREIVDCLGDESEWLE